MKIANPKIPTIDIKEYGGKQVAIVDGRIVANGETSKSVIDKARKVFPKKPLHEIAILAVPKSLYVIYHV